MKRGRGRTEMYALTTIYGNDQVTPPAVRLFGNKRDALRAMRDAALADPELGRNATALVDGDAAWQDPNDREATRWNVVEVELPSDDPDEGTRP